MWEIILSVIAKLLDLIGKNGEDWKKKQLIQSKLDSLESVRLKELQLESKLKSGCGDASVLQSELDKVTEERKNLYDKTLSDAQDLGNDDILNRISSIASKFPKGSTK